MNYEIDVSKEPGERIQNLTWPDGTPVKEDEVFEAAVTGYRYDVLMSRYGTVYEEEDGLPELVEKNMHSELCGVQGMIADYIEHVKEGRLVPENENNWRITGIHWNPELHALGVRLLKEKVLNEALLKNGAAPLREEMFQNLQE